MTRVERVGVGDHACDQRVGGATIVTARGDDCQPRPAPITSHITDDGGKRKRPKGAHVDFHFRGAPSILARHPLFTTVDPFRDGRQWATS